VFADGIFLQIHLAKRLNAKCETFHDESHRSTKDIPIFARTMAKNKKNPQTIP